MISPSYGIVGSDIRVMSFLFFFFFFFLVELFESASSQFDVVIEEHTIHYGGCCVLESIMRSNNRVDDMKPKNSSSK